MYVGINHILFEFPYEIKDILLFYYSMVSLKRIYF